MQTLLYIWGLVSLVNIILYTLLCLYANKILEQEDEYVGERFSADIDIFTLIFAAFIVLIPIYHLFTLRTMIVEGIDIAEETVDSFK